jgi:hypothetical protein
LPGDALRRRREGWEEEGDPRRRRLGFPPGRSRERLGRSGYVLIVTLFMESSLSSTIFSLDAPHMLEAELLHVVPVGPLHREAFTSLPILPSLAVTDHMMVDVLQPWLTNL